MQLKEVEGILGPDAEEYLFPCIRDLLTNGPGSVGFSKEDYAGPSRQDITQYMAAWFRHIGISADECRDWMIEYCVDVLSAISKSSKSKIRHSTKSNIKYIYRSEVAFECGCEDNVVKALCDRNCPLYDGMLRKYERKKAGEADRSYEPERPAMPDTADIEACSVKERHREQFEKGMEVVKENVTKGVSRKAIVALLNESGFMTRTGRKWTYPVLSSEMKRLKP